MLSSYDSVRDKRVKTQYHSYQHPIPIRAVTELRPFFKKYVDTTKIPTASRFDWGINFIAIRYTDVLMEKAECVLNGAPGSQSTTVDSIVNLVRDKGRPAGDERVLRCRYSCSMSGERNSQMKVRAGSICKGAAILSRS